MRQGGLASRLCKRILQRECKICIRAKIFVHPCHRDFSRESGSESAENVSEQWSSRRPVIATFQENPAARIRTANIEKMSCQLLMRIPRREPQKTVTTTTTRFGTYSFRLGILCRSMQNVHGTRARATVRGPPGSTIIIYKEIIRFNHNNYYYYLAVSTEKTTE